MCYNSISSWCVLSLSTAFIDDMFGIRRNNNALWKLELKVHIWCTSFVFWLSVGVLVSFMNKGVCLAYPTTTCYYNDNIPAIVLDSRGTLLPSELQVNLGHTPVAKCFNPAKPLEWSEFVGPNRGSQTCGWHSDSSLLCPSSTYSTASCWATKWGSSILAHLDINDPKTKRRHDATQHGCVHWTRSGAYFSGSTLFFTIAFCKIKFIERLVVGT